MCYDDDQYGSLTPGDGFRHYSYHVISLSTYWGKLFLVDIQKVFRRLQNDIQDIIMNVVNRQLIANTLDILHRPVGHEVINSCRCKVVTEIDFSSISDSESLLSRCFQSLLVQFRYVNCVILLNSYRKRIVCGSLNRYPDYQQSRNGMVPSNGRTPLDPIERL